MNGWAILGVGLGAAVAVLGVTVAVSMWWPARASAGRETVDAIKARVAEQRMDNTLWAAGFPHDAPDHELSVPDAQMTMQRHRGCRVDVCRRKRAAWQTLVDAGKIRPDAGRQNYGQH